MTESCCVLTFPEYRDAGEALARALGAPCAPVELHRFPDGESRVRIPVKPIDHAVVCRSLFYPNDKLIELLLTIQTLRESGVGRITLIAPYLCYMRQDAAFAPGEVVSQRVIGRFLAAQADEIITVDPHLHRVRRLEEVVPAKRAVAISAAPLIAAFLRRRARDAVLVGPDSESEQWVRAIAEIGHLRYAVAEKQRSGDRAVQVTLDPGSLAGEEVVLVDDIASTGRTLAAAAARVVQCGARTVKAFVSHALFADDAEACIRAAGITEVWSTDSIPHPSNRIALADLLATQIR
ncbi:MAG: ribose-phosphate diphosphokinase [Gammaproteobacteria bacterium]